MRTIALTSFDYSQVRSKALRFDISSFYRKSSFHIFSFGNVTELVEWYSQAYIADLLHPLKQDELEIAQQIWHALKSGAPDAHARLKGTTENVREAILQELAEASDNRKTPSRPLG